jgi:hypothetical protein
MQRLSTPWISAVFLIPACAIVAAAAEQGSARPAEFRVTRTSLCSLCPSWIALAAPCRALSPATSQSWRMACRSRFLRFRSGMDLPR